MRPRGGAGVKPLVLASSSPRRRRLLRGMALNFRCSSPTSTSVPCRANSRVPTSGGWRSPRREQSPGSSPRGAGRGGSSARTRWSSSTGGSSASPATPRMPRDARASVRAHPRGAHRRGARPRRRRPGTHRGGAQPGRDEAVRRGDHPPLRRRRRAARQGGRLRGAGTRPVAWSPGCPGRSRTSSACRWSGSGGPACDGRGPVPPRGGAGYADPLVRPAIGCDTEGFFSIPGGDLLLAHPVEAGEPPSRAGTGPRPEKEGRDVTGHT